MLTQPYENYAILYLEKRWMTHGSLLTLMHVPTLFRFIESGFSGWYAVKIQNADRVKANIAIKKNLNWPKYICIFTNLLFLLSELFDSIQDSFEYVSNPFARATLIWGGVWGLHYPNAHAY